MASNPSSEVTTNVEEHFQLLQLLHQLKLQGPGSDRAPVQLNANQIELIAQITMRQGENFYWLSLRIGVMTSSVIYKVLRAADKENPAKSTIEAVLGTNAGLQNIPAISYARENQPNAIEQFKREQGCEVQKTGLWLHPSGVLGGSPNGLIGENEILQVKCPFKYKESDLREVAKSEGWYVSMNQEGEYCLNRKNPQGNEYYHQVQANLYFTNRKVCHFYAWSPKGAVHFKIHKDPAWKENIEKLLQFHANTIVPKLQEFLENVYFELVSGGSFD